MTHNNRHIGREIAAVVVVFLLSFMPVSAFADCSNPPGVEGLQIYNGTHNVMQFCDGTNWVSMSGAESDPLTTLSCSDGELAKWHAGDSEWKCAPDGGSDNLGDHLATQDIDAVANDVVNVRLLHLERVSGAAIPKLQGGGTLNGSSGCSLPWGGSVSHGIDVTAYEYPNTGCSNTETRSCNDGALSGSFVNGTCADTVGEVEYTSPGTYSWTVPDGITSVSVVCVGGGGGGGHPNGSEGATGGGGGALRYANNVSVTPGDTITVTVGAGGLGGVAPPVATPGGNGGTSSFGTFCSASGGQGGGYWRTAGGSGAGGSSGTGDGGGNGGNAAINTSNPGIASSGGGAGGYSGDGGNGGGAYVASTAGTGGAGGGGGYSTANGYSGAGGGGVGIYGEGASGAAGAGSGTTLTGGGGGSGGASGGQTTAYMQPGAAGGTYGGGGGGGRDTSGGDGGGGAVRIIWPGDQRQFPSTMAGTHDPTTCALPWGGTTANGTTVTAYTSLRVPVGNSCVAETRSCNGGVLSGSNEYESCIVDVCANSVSAGTVCADGTVAANTTPDGGLRMFTTTADQSSGAYWGTYTHLVGVTASAAFKTGASNTVAIAAAVDAGSGTYNPDDGYTPNAAKICDDLDVHGYDDWYLPAADEMSVLWSARSAIGGFGSSLYWTSTEGSSNGAVYKNWNDNGQYQTGKTEGNKAVRCVRKE